MSAVDNPKLAVLIDADNASASLAKELLEEVAKFGVATVKRAYGDWTSQNLVGWKEHLNRHAIQPIQQFAYTKGKNSTDASLIIDAMDLLYADNVDGFCLVSSDSDFTRLATRLRESRKVVYGLGERKTPEAFRAACDRFVFFEVLKRNGSNVDATAREPAPIGDVPDLEQSLRQAFDAVSRDNGWATVSSVGSYMAKNNPSFDTRLYGFRKLSDMIRRQPFVEVKESTDGNGGPLLAVRLKQRPPDPSRGASAGASPAAPAAAAVASAPVPSADTTPGAPASKTPRGRSRGRSGTGASARQPAPVEASASTADFRSSDGASFDAAESGPAHVGDRASPAAEPVAPAPVATTSTASTSSATSDHAAPNGGSSGAAGNDAPAHDGAARAAASDGDPAFDTASASDAADADMPAPAAKRSRRKRS